MANTSRANGLRPVKYLSGAPYTGAFRTYFIPSGDGTAVFVGDLVKADTTGDPAASGGLAKGIQSVIRAAAGNASIGVVVGFAIDATNLNTPQYRVASTGRYVYVADDPNILFEIQAGGVGVALADVGLNADVTATAGSTVTGASGLVLDVSAMDTTATRQLRIMEVTGRVDNEITTSDKVVVKINNHQLGSSTGVAGV